MKITKLLLIALIIPTLSLLSNCSDKSSMVESFDRITENSAAARRVYLNSSGLEKKTTELEKKSLLISKYDFETLEDAIAAYSEDMIVGVNVYFGHVDNARRAFLNSQDPVDAFWQCADENGEKVDCKLLSGGYPESVTNVAFVKDSLTCSGRLCRSSESDQVVSVEMTPSDVVASKVVLSVSNAAGEFTATSRPVSEMILYPSTWIIPVSIGRIHELMQTRYFHDKYPNVKDRTSFNYVGVEEDLAELIMLKDAIKKTKVRVAKSYIDGNLESDINDVEGLSSVSFVKISKNTLDLLTPFIAVGVLIMVLLSLKKIDRRLLSKKELPDDIAYSVIYNSDNLSRCITILLVGLPVVMCVLPPFLMPPESFVESANIFGLNINEMAVKHPFFSGWFGDSNEGFGGMIAISLLCCAICIILVFSCLKKISAQRAKINSIEQEVVGDDDAPSDYLVSYSYSVPSVTVDNLRI
tara:strand:+ start:6314 stop:7720 length:1407 start_codon:yes stop_codon:yes gene_type:complete